MSRPPETVDLRIDGARVAALDDSRRRNFEDPADEGAVEARVAVEAGPHVVGVSFRRSTLMNETRYPQYFPWGNSATFATNTGSVASAERQLAWTSRDRSTRKDPGETPSRAAASSSAGRAQARRQEDGCARKILGNGGAARVSPAGRRRPTSIC